MENKLSYTLVGIFVFGLSACFVGIFLWLSNYSDNEKFKYYIINTNESVSGLNIQAPVKFRGLHIGEVKNLEINPNNSEEVSILIQVKYKTPIKNDTYAVIEPQGITGLSYLQLQGGTNDAPLLETNDDNPAIIHTKDSLFSQLDTSFRSMSAKINQVLNSVDVLLNEKNLKNLENILNNFSSSSQNIAEFSKSMPNWQKNIDLILKDFKSLEQKGLKSIDKLSLSVEDISLLLKKDGLKALQDISSAANATQNMASDVSIFTQDIILPINKSLQNLDLLLLDAKDFINQLQQSPSDLLYKQNTNPLAPGE